MSKYSWFVLFHIQSDAHPSLGVLAIPQSLFSGCPSVVTFHLCCSVELFYTSFLQGVWLWYRSSHDTAPSPHVHSSHSQGMWGEEVTLGQTCGQEGLGSWTPRPACAALSWSCSWLTMSAHSSTLPSCLVLSLACFSPWSTVYLPSHLRPTPPEYNGLQVSVCSPASLQATPAAFILPT